MLRRLVSDESGEAAAYETINSELKRRIQQMLDEMRYRQRPDLPETGGYSHSASKENDDG